MSEVIKVPKKTPSVKVTEVKQQPAPDLSFLSDQQFQRDAVITLEERLLRLGIIIPRDKIKLLAPALTKIGKTYYSLATSDSVF